MNAFLWGVKDGEKEIKKEIDSQKEAAKCEALETVVRKHLEANIGKGKWEADVIRLLFLLSIEGLMWIGLIVFRFFYFNFC